MTALFVVIFVEQWLSAKSHLPALIGVASAVIALSLFGPSQMVLPAMVFMLVVLLSAKKKISVGGDL
jgi:4-azaleucine resistance transporter AzlC